MKNKHNIKHFPKKDKGYACNLKFVIVESVDFHIFSWTQNSTYIILEKHRERIRLSLKQSHLIFSISFSWHVIASHIGWQRNIFFKRCLFLTGCELEKNPIQKKQQSVKNERNYRRI